MYIGISNIDITSLKTNAFRPDAQSAPV